MAIIGNSNVEYKKDEKTRYHEAENIKDITQTDLKKLKTELKPETETDLDSKLTKINEHVETYFDWFLSRDREKSITLDVNWVQITDIVKNIVASWDKTKLDALANHVINQVWYEKDILAIKDIEIQNVLKGYKFELIDIWNQVKESTTGQSDQPFNKDLDGGKNDSDHPFNKDSNDGKTDNYQKQDDYIDPYKQTGYTDVNKDRQIENIYRDNKVSKVLERIFDNEQWGEEIRRGMFNINLDKEDGLAGIIIAIREAIANKDNDDSNNVHKKLYNKLVEKGILRISGDTIDLEFSRKNLVELLDSNDLVYTRKWWLDDEKAKIAKLLSRAQRADLDTFASLLQSKDDVVMAVKEWNNTLEMTWQNREKSERRETQTSLITDTNVLEFLCDFNSDWEISAEYKRKNNKEQRNHWDVWVLFWQQVLFTVDQAIAVKEVELGTPQWEQVVISSIIKNMNIADSRNLETTHLITMQKDPTKCTKANLTKLINGDVTQGIYPMPEMKIFFLDAIKKINGWNQEVQPDLYDTLVGKEAESFLSERTELLSLYETEIALKNKLDEILAASQEPTTKEMIRKNGLVRVRETVFTQIMTVIDHVEITTNDGAKTQLQAAGVDKWRETRALKKELLESTINSLIQTWIHYSETWWWRFMLGYGKEGTSKSGRTKRARGAGGWLIISWSNIELAINLTWEIAEQYNYQRVINANLSKVKSAKYVGIEWWVLAGIGTQDRWVDVEWYAGINWQQDPVAGINQINKQYESVSQEIFDIREASPDILSDKVWFTNYMLGRITGKKTDKVYGKFIANNEQHLIDNLAFIVRYMDANNFFWDNSILKKYPQINTPNAINTLLDIIQSGNIESRRSDIIAWLHGKVALTKLSFGVTTNALTLKSWSGVWSPNAPTPGSTSGETTGQWNTTTGNGGNESWGNESWGNLGESRFGVAGVYIGLRISTWKNSYVPNEAQYLFTQYETGQGIWTEYITNPLKDLNKYGEYLIALYNDPQKRLWYSIHGKTLVITFDSKWSNLTLAKFLNIHATTDAQPWFSLKGNVLTIGNVGEMGAYTITEAKGVRRILCLWSKKLDDAERLTWDNATIDVDPMKPQETGNNLPWTQTRIQTEIIDKMTGTWAWLDIAKTETAAFISSEAKLQKPTGKERATTTITFEPATIEGSLLKQWSLTITKNADDSYTVALDDTNPTDKLTINYIDQKAYQEAKNKAIHNKESRSVTTTFDEEGIKKEFALPTNISTVFAQDTEEALSVFDNYNKTLYREFMESIVDKNIDSFINATDYGNAFEALKKILTTNKKYNELPDLKALIERTDLTPNEKMLIVDKFKTIFSYVIELTDGKNDGKKLSSLISVRKLTYTTMKWPNGENFPTMDDYRTTIVNNLKNENTLERTSVPNLIGFTAFYRLKDDKGRKYAMTPVGWTNVLSSWDLETAMLPLNNWDIPKTKDWFIKNLNVNKDNKKMILEKIVNLLNKNGINIPIDSLEPKLEKLLKTNELILQDLTLDSFKKISIDINRVFYLLGECGNESLGMNIKGIKIHDVNVPEANFTGSGIPEKELEGGMDLNIKSHSIASKVLTQEKRVGIKHHQSNMPIKPKGSSTAGETTNPWEITTWEGGNE